MDTPNKLCICKIHRFAEDFWENITLVSDKKPGKQPKAGLLGYINTIVLALAQVIFFTVHGVGLCFCFVLQTGLIAQ